MSELPAGWELADFPDVAFFQEGPGLRKFQYRDTGIPFLNIRTFVDGRVDTSLCKFLDPNEVKEKYRHFLAEPGDILIAISGSIGKWAVVAAEDVPLVLNTSIMRFRPLDEAVLDRNFLLWSLRSADFADQAWGSSTGSAQKNVGPSHIQNFTLKLPPLPEQRRIVAKIDSVTGKSKRARDHLDHISRLVENYKQAVLAAAFNPDRMDLWTRAPLEEVLADALIGLVRGKTDQSATQGVPYIRMNHFDLNGRWNEDSLTCVEASREEVERYELRDGDLLFNTRNSFELVGKVGLWRGRPTGHLYNNNLLRLRFKPHVEPAFAFYQMISPHFRSYLQSEKSATTSVCAIYQRSIMAAPFAYPQRPAQLALAAQLDAAFIAIDRLAAEAASARKLIDHLNQAVLAKAIRGELVPQDPADQPASALLERIKAERGNELPSKRRSRT